MASIVREQAILFDSPLFGIMTGVGEDYEALLDFAGQPAPTSSGRLSSIVAAHARLFGSGNSSSERAVAREARDLMAWLDGRGRSTDDAPRRAAMVPGNLGMAFARKGLGAPLFGRFRPRSVPAAPGFLVFYRSTEADGTARLAAAPLAEGTTVRYRGIGAEVSSTAPWMRCSIAPTDGEPRFTPRTASGGREAVVFRSDRYTVRMAAAPVRERREPESWQADPYEYGYLYFFDLGPSLHSRLGVFLRDLFSGRFGVPPREAGDLAAVFIERLLRR